MRFLIDVDDVLTDFVGRMSPIVSGILDREWSYDELSKDEWDLFTILSKVQRDALFAIMERPGFCATFNPAPGAQAAVRTLREMGCEMFAVTAPNYSPFWVSERTHWLEQFFQIPADHVVHTHAKYLVSGDFFLDDRPSHVREWEKHNPQGVPMLWTTPHNQRAEGFDDVRVFCWDHVWARIRCNTGLGDS